MLLAVSRAVAPAGGWGVCRRAQQSVGCPGLWEDPAEQPALSPRSALRFLGSVPSLGVLRQEGRVNPSSALHARAERSSSSLSI